jgi:hypothetical protein
VSDPYFTTRTTRKQGMGLAFLRQNAEQTGGSLHISSTLGVGTTVTATFHHNHWDMPPLGDIPAAIIMLIGGNPDIEFCFNYTQNDTDFTLDTREVKEIFSPIPLSNLGVLKALREMITENIAPS